MAAPKGNKNAKGNKGGRPTKFEPEFTESLRKYFSIEPYKVVAVESSIEYFASGKVKKKSEKTRPVPNKLPTLYSFAKSIGVAYWTVQHWMKEGGKLSESDENLTNEQRAKIEFSHAYKDAKEEQKEFLISIGLAGAAPPASFIFTAKNMTNMRDKQEVEHSGEVSYINDEQRKRILDREKRRLGVDD